MAINYFSEQQFYCTPAEIIALPLADGSFYSVRHTHTRQVGHANSMGTDAGVLCVPLLLQLCSYSTGDDVLQQFSIPGAFDPAAAHAHLWLCCGVLAILCVFYRALALFLLYRFSWQVKDLA